MPAVELGRLQQQVAQLSDLFQQPAGYLHGVEDLLRDHGGPAHRQGRVKGLRPVLVSYEVPPPLLKLFTLEMSAQAREYPAEALTIADGLWSRPTMETRQLAISLLGNISTFAPEEIMSRLETWADENREQILVPKLAENGTKTLRITHQEELLELAARLLQSGNSRKHVLAIGVLQSLVRGGQVSNLPKLFDLLAVPCKDPDRKIRPELADLLASLVHLSPRESEYFLFQMLGESPTEGARWLVRQAAKALPEEGRARLRGVL